MRGGGNLPYDPSRPLRLPGGRRRRRPPQFNAGSMARILIPLLAVVGVGVGVFVGVSVIIDEDGASAPPAAESAVAVETAPAAEQSAAGQAGASEAAVGTSGQAAAQAGPLDAAMPAAAASSAGSAASQVAPEPDVPAALQILTPADLGGAPVLVERAAAVPVPPGAGPPQLADGSVYDPTDPTLVLSSVWAPGTILQLTRLPGGPLLSAEDTVQLIGKTVQVEVRAQGTFSTELQLSPATYATLAIAIEPIIAVRIEVLEAPARE